MVIRTESRIALIAARLVCTLACWLPVAPVAADEVVWFDDLAAPPHLATEDQHALGRYVWLAVTAGTEVANTFPAEWQLDTEPRIAFVAVSDGVDPAGVGCGSGRGLAAAVDLAAATARAKLKSTRPVRWVRLDLVDTVLTQAAEPEPAPASVWSRRRTGLATDRSVGLALLPDELLANTLLDGAGRVRRSAVSLYARYHPHRARPSRDGRRWDDGAVHRFTTIGLSHDKQGTVPLVRGRRRLAPLERKDLEAAAGLGARYLAAAVDDGGRFVYSYRPDSNTVPRTYNVLRHAGSVYAMLEAYELTRHEPTLAAARRALTYLRSTVEPLTVGRRRLHGVVERRYVKLGGNALAVLALSKYVAVTADRTDLPLARQLAEFIVAVQLPDGRFRVHKAHHRTGAPTDFVSEYYPGEAVFALMRLYAVDPNPDPRWLDAAAKAAGHLIDVRDADATIETQIHDHWLLYGLNELHRAQPDPAYLAHTRRILAAMRLTQHVGDPDDDWYGGYYVPPGATATSTRTEGLAAACRLLRDFGTAAEAADALETATLGATFTLKRQLGPEAAMFFRRPQRALGGVPHSLANAEIRIDYVQHAISCWLAVAQLLPQESP